MPDRTSHRAWSRQFRRRRQRKKPPTRSSEITDNVDPCCGEPGSAQPQPLSEPDPPRSLPAAPTAPDSPLGAAELPAVPSPSPLPLPLPLPPPSPLPPPPLALG